MISKLAFTRILCATAAITILAIFTAASAEQYLIPYGVRNNATLWGDGQIGDQDFVQGIQYLIQNKIMIIPQGHSSSQPSTHIPNWVKNDAKWWGNGEIRDSDFVNSIQYLIQVGIINIQTPAIINPTPIADTTPPVITLLGSNPVTVHIGSTFADAGATASDNVDGNITSSIVVSNPVNTSVAGTYTVTYNVNDTAGNAAIQVTRTVNVVNNLPPDTTPPLITLRGSNLVTVQLGSTYIDAGAKASDPDDGNLTSYIIKSNPVNTSVVGTYTVTYNVKDTVGNAAIQVTRTVNVVNNIPPDTTPPVITLRGSNPVTVQVGSTYADAGATASDNLDGNITPSIVVSNPVNTSVAGTYTIIYKVKDLAGNSGQATRTVKVIVP